MIGRIASFIDSLHISVRAFEQQISASNGLIRKAITNSTDIQSKWLAAIAENYPQLNMNWLLTGEGTMLRSDESAQVSYEPTIGVPYYDVDFIAGFDQIYNNQTLVPAHNVVFKPFEKATLWCNVSGHSMEQKINHGDIIALKECTIDDVQYGEIYAVVLDTIRTIKVLRKASDPNKFRYVPFNHAEYDDQEFEKSRILKIYEVLGSISKFF